MALTIGARSERVKITVVGSGFVGQTTAMRLVEKRLGEVCLIDIIEGKPQGLALDLKEASPVEGYPPLITGTNDYADTAGSDIVVITAGFPRQPGMSRMDLLGKNATIMTDVIASVVPGSPSAILIVVSNPLDEMTFLAAEKSGFPKERVVGMAGVLDSARLRFFIAEELDVSPTEVQAMTLGSHGDSMVALPRHATVKGRPLPELVDEQTLDRLFQRTRDGGAEGDAPGVRLGDGAVRDLRDLRGRPGAAGARRRRGDRQARPQRGRTREASGGCRRHPREVRGPRGALGRQIRAGYLTETVRSRGCGGS